jgi:flagellar motor component MotA
MSDILSNLVAGTIVLGFFGSIFQYVVLKPLNTTISELKLTIYDLRSAVKANEARWHSLEIKLTAVDQSAKSAHHRLDSLEEEVKSV